MQEMYFEVWTTIQRQISIFFRLAVFKDILLKLVIDKITEVKSLYKHNQSKIFLYLPERSYGW